MVRRLRSSPGSQPLSCQSVATLHPLHPSLISRRLTERDMELYAVPLNNVASAFIVTCQVFPFEVRPSDGVSMCPDGRQCASTAISGWKIHRSGYKLHAYNCFHATGSTHDDRIRSDDPRCQSLACGRTVGRHFGLIIWAWPMHSFRLEVRASMPHSLPVVSNLRLIRWLDNTWRRVCLGDNYCPVQLAV